MKNKPQAPPKQIPYKVFDSHDFNTPAYGRTEQAQYHLTIYTTRTPNLEPHVFYKLHDGRLVEWSMLESMLKKGNISYIKGIDTKEGDANGTTRCT